MLSLSRLLLSVGAGCTRCGGGGASSERQNVTIRNVMQLKCSVDFSLSIELKVRIRGGREDASIPRVEGIIQTGVASRTPLAFPMSQETTEELTHRWGRE